ncbi:hypothetical protein SAMN06272759_10345 [Novosphingobium sp. B1]|nr:hypothetical protein SAMN06272759_10345 [Novosphingobium sp. B1]
MLRWLACLMRRHKPVRNLTEQVGLRQVSKCQQCGATIGRIGGGAWRPIVDAPVDRRNS